MGSTNKTTNYELSQFIGTDKPAWLQDYNGDMQKIDTGIHNAKTAADNAALAASAAQDDATSALSGVSSLNTEVGNIQRDLGNAEGNINTINSLIGNGTPTTTDQTIIGAINELHDDIQNIDLMDRKFLFVGDSYGEEAGEWPSLVISYLRLGTNGTNLARGGASFWNNNPDYKYLTQISDYAGSHTTEELAAITDIVVAGGLNDALNSDPSAYSNVNTTMTEFDTYVRSNFPNAKVHLGFIGNGDDTASLMSIRNYACRQCCRYVYYRNASALGWNILHNVEYALTGTTANISSDGVHPSATGSEELGRAIAQALLTGSADVNYPISSATVTSSLGTAAGSIQYKIHNELASIYMNVFYITLPDTAEFQSGQSVELATLQNLRFNAPVEFNGVVRLYGASIDGTPSASTYTYLKARFLFSGIKLYMEIEEAGATYTFPSGGTLVVINNAITFDSMVLE